MNWSRIAIFAGAVAVLGPLSAYVTANGTDVLEGWKARRAVTASLRDPDSAKISNVRSVTGAKGQRAVCGVVNARNGFGGWAGPSPFMYFTDDGSVYVIGDSATESQREAWRNVCDDDARAASMKKAAEHNAWCEDNPRSIYCAPDATVTTTRSAVPARPTCPVHSNGWRAC